ncbi:MAG: ABC transporter permease, partial [Candidatus Omnitrophica bacterium]|nr:ABC transporter permease [Candidatus Omnitrophota bacterium]
MRVELFLAQRYLFRGKRRHLSLVSIMAVAGIALGVATLVIVTSVMNGFDHDLTSRLLSFNYHLIIESNDNSKLDIIREEIKKVSQVKSASLFLHTQIFAKFGDYIVPLLV